MFLLVTPQPIETLQKMFRSYQHTAPQQYQAQERRVCPEPHPLRGKMKLPEYVDRMAPTAYRQYIENARFEDAMLNENDKMSEICTEMKCIRNGTNFKSTGNSKLIYWMFTKTKYVFRAKLTKYISPNRLGFLVYYWNHDSRTWKLFTSNDMGECSITTTSTESGGGIATFKLMLETTGTTKEPFVKIIIGSFEDGIIYQSNPFRIAAFDKGKFKPEFPSPNEKKYTMLIEPERPLKVPPVDLTPLYCFGERTIPLDEGPLVCLPQKPLEVIDPVDIYLTSEEDEDLFLSECAIAVLEEQESITREKQLKKIDSMSNDMSDFAYGMRFDLKDIFESYYRKRKSEQDWFDPPRKSKKIEEEPTLLNDSEYMALFK